MFQRYLMHDRLLVRFLALLGLVMVVFLGAWVVSYLFLPEGVLRNRNFAQALAGSDLAGGSVWLEWLRLLAVNLAAMFLLCVAPNVFRSAGNYPLGYTTVTLLALIFGVTLGTNSLAVSLGGKVPPSLAILGSSGLYEIAAYVLAVAATISISRYRLVGQWPRQTVEPIAPTNDPSVIRERTIGLLVAVAILVIACGWEAYRFSLVAG